jgi:hypothetical protein
VSTELDILTASSLVRHALYISVKGISGTFKISSDMGKWGSPVVN